MRNIDNLKELEKVKNKHDLVLIVFYTPQSENSLHVHTILQELEQNMEVTIFGIDVSQVKTIHTNYNIDSVPTVLVFRNGSTAEIIKGKQTLAFYEKLFTGIDIDNNDSADNPNHNVTVYTTPTCQYCTAVKNYLDQKGINYDEIDVSEDQTAAQKLMNQTGQKGVPQIDIDGNYIVGYNKQEIDNLLNL